MKSDMQNSKENEIDAMLLKALKKEPNLDLPYSFSLVTSKKVKEIKPFNLMTYVIAVLAAVLVIIVGICMLSFSANNTSKLILNTLIQFKYLIGSVLLITLLIEFLDQKFVKSSFK